MKRRQGPLMTDDPMKLHKWRPWRFSLRFLLLLTFGIALWLGYRVSDFHLADKKATVRTRLDEELLRRHFTVFDVGPARNPKIDLGNYLLPRSSNLQFQILQVGPGVVHAKASAATSLDEFQSEALKRINRGESEVWQSTWTGGIRYVGRLKTTRSCATCHISSSTGAPVGSATNGNYLDIVVGLDRNTP